MSKKNKRKVVIKEDGASPKGGSKYERKVKERRRYAKAHGFDVNTPWPIMGLGNRPSVRQRQEQEVAK